MGRTCRDVALWIAIGMVACAPAPPVVYPWTLTGADPQTDSQAAPSASPQGRDVPVMHQRFELIRTMTLAIVDADDDRARALATELALGLRAERDEETPTSSWAAHVDELIVEAEAVAAAPDHGVASSNVAQLARACGACHAQMLGETKLPPAPEIGRAESLSDRMQQHSWAANRMWEALVAPSEERWIQGTTTFVALPDCDQLHEEKAATDTCTRVQKLARSAGVTRSWPDRTEAFGKLLATCSDCHRQGG